MTPTVESDPEAEFDGRRAGATHRRKALASGGLHPPCEGDFRLLLGQTLSVRAPALITIAGLTESPMRD